MSFLLFLCCILAFGPYPAALQWQKDSEEVRCPSFVSSSNHCNCEASTDGLDFTCSQANLGDIQSIVSAARFAVKTPVSYTHLTLPTIYSV